MEKERNSDNDKLDRSHEYFKKKEKLMMMIPISFHKNQNHHIIEY